MWNSLFIDTNIETIMFIKYYYIIYLAYLTVNLMDVAEASFTKNFYPIGENHA